MAASVVVNYVLSLWPFSTFKVDDLKISDRLVKKLPIPESSKPFVYAIREPQSQAVIYVICVQNLSERSAYDADCLIREIKPDVVVAQVGPGMTLNDLQKDCAECLNGDKCNGGMVEDGTECQVHLVPTSSFEVLKRCFVHKLNKERYENAAGRVVLREIFGIGLNEHILAAKRAAGEVGSTFLLLDSPFTQWNTDSDSSTVGQKGHLGNMFQGFDLEPNSLVAQRLSPMVPVSSRGFFGITEIQSAMIKALGPYLIDSSSLEDGDCTPIQPQKDYNVPQFAHSVYPLLADLHDIFVDIPIMGRALAHSQKILHDINRGDVVDSRLLSEIHVFRIAVEALRIALTNVGRLPSGKMGNSNSSKCEFSELSTDDKCQALLVQALRSQTEKYKSVVALVDASALAGLRKHWETPVPLEVKSMVQQLIISWDHDSELSNSSDTKKLLSGKPVVAVGAGATALLGASSLSKVAPVSTFMKILTFKTPASVKLFITQTQKVLAMVLGPGKAAAPGIATSGVKSSVIKATASAEKIRAVAHSVIASAEKTSFSAMRTAFYEIMRNRRKAPVGVLPWATFGCSVATCAGLLVYGDGIEYAVESLPAAPSIASLGRGLQGLREASQLVQQSESSKFQQSVESFFHRFKKMKVQ